MRVFCSEITRGEGDVGHAVVKAAREVDLRVVESHPLRLRGSRWPCDEIEIEEIEIEIEERVGSQGR